MRTYDFSPLLRSSIAFDRRLDYVEAAQRAGEDNYPPYNFGRIDADRYQIVLAVAEFAPDEITMNAEQNVVTIEGKKAGNGDRDYLYRGIAVQAFKRQFNLADYVQVRSASFVDGLLRIDLVRDVPEAVRPRRIHISGRAPQSTERLKTAQAA